MPRDSSVLNIWMAPLPPAEPLEGSLLPARPGLLKYLANDLQELSSRHARSGLLATHPMKVRRWLLALGAIALVLVIVAALLIAVLVFFGPHAG